MSSEPIKAEIIQATPEPTAIQLLQQAIGSGISVDAIQALAELADRQDRKHAAQAFNEAMAAFKAECPPITKSKLARDEEKNRDLYWYAPLEVIQRAIDPVLQAHGLSYTWDTVNEAGIAVTCTIHHIGGHFQTSVFRVPTDVGTRMMNSAQKLASGMMYGKRYSLINALGLIVEGEDDDSRSMKPEYETPSANRSAPKQAPRGERIQVAELRWLFGQWRERDGKEFPEPEAAREFMLWVGVATGHNFATVNDCKKAENWSRSMVMRCSEALGLVEG